MGAAKRLAQDQAGMLAERIAEPYGECLRLICFSHKGEQCWIKDKVFCQEGYCLRCQIYQDIISEEKGGKMKTEQEIRDEIAKIETVNDKQGWILGIELIRVNKAIIKILQWVLNEDSIKVKEG